MIGPGPRHVTAGQFGVPGELPPDATAGYPQPSPHRTIPQKGSSKRQIPIGSDPPPGLTEPGRRGVVHETTPVPCGSDIRRAEKLGNHYSRKARNGSRLV